MESKMIKFEDAEAIARDFVTQNPDALGQRYEGIEIEKLVPNRSVNSLAYWEFWFIQEDAKLSDIEFARNIGIDPAKVLTFAGQPPSILISKLRIAKSSGELELIKMT